MRTEEAKETAMQAMVLNKLGIRSNGPNCLIDSPGPDKFVSR